MNEMKTHIVCVFLLCVLLEVANASDCLSFKYKHGKIKSSTYIHCSKGCCGTAEDRYCCAWSGGEIGGIVIGGVVGFAIIVSLIVCCCKSYNKPGYHGTVVQPAQKPGLFVVSTTSNHGEYPMQNTGEYPMQNLGGYPVQNGVELSQPPHAALDTAPPPYPGLPDVKPHPGLPDVKPPVDEQHPPPYPGGKS